MLTEVARQILEPLCDTTAALLAPLRLMPNDRLEVSMGQDENHWVMQAYGIGLGGSKVSASPAASSEWFKRLAERKVLRRAKGQAGSWVYYDPKFGHDA